MFTNKPAAKPEASLKDLNTYLDKLLSEEEKKLGEQLKTFEKMMEKIDPPSSQEHKKENEKLAQEKAALLARLHSANPTQLLEIKAEVNKQLQEQQQIFLKQLKTIKLLCENISNSTSSLEPKKQSRRS